MRTVVLRVVALSLLLLLTLVGVIAVRTSQRLPDTTIYFIRDQGVSFTLEPTYRKTGKRSVPQRVELQLKALTDGPDSEEAEGGLSSAVPAATRLLSAQLDDGVLSVNLSADFEEGGGTSSMLGRLYQLYYTLTQPRDVNSVQLAVEGRPVTVFGGEGLLLSSPWVRSQHADLPVW